jgi:hypothetical protein
MSNPIHVTTKQFPVFQLYAECRTKIICSMIEKGNITKPMLISNKEKVFETVAELTEFAVTGKS